jgi:hypothetical protein
MNASKGVGEEQRWSDLGAELDSGKPLVDLVRDDSEAGPIGAMKDAANEAAKRGRNKVTNNDYQYFECYKKSTSSTTTTTPSATVASRLG